MVTVALCAIAVLVGAGMIDVYRIRRRALMERLRAEERAANPPISLTPGEVLPFPAEEWRGYWHYRQSVGPMQDEAPHQVYFDAVGRLIGNCMCSWCHLRRVREAAGK